MFRNSGLQGKQIVRTLATAQILDVTICYPDLKRLRVWGPGIEGLLNSGMHGLGFEM